MKAVVLDRIGPPGVLKVSEQAEPEPGVNQVRVTTEYVGINYADVKLSADRLCDRIRAEQNRYLGENDSGCRFDPLEILHSLNNAKTCLFDCIPYKS